MQKRRRIEWIKVIKSVFLRRQKGIKPPEAAYATRAQRYFHSEASILFDMPLADVENFIGDSIAKNT